MTEAKALVLTMVAMLALCLCLLLGLSALGASDQAIAFACFLVMCGGAYASASVVMRYAEKRPSAERSPPNR